MMRDVMMCVVDTGMPKCVASWMTVAALVSAAKPWMGSSLITLDPSVWMMRHPPEYVPTAMVTAQAIFTHSGISNTVISPLANNASVMMPMVFWASLLPWEKAMKPADMG